MTEIKHELAVTYEPIVVKELFDGVQALFRFPNNYGASVVRHSGSYGAGAGLWELAVLRWQNQNFELTYDTEVTDDVIGYLTPNDVDGYLLRIASLRNEENEK